MRNRSFISISVMPVLLRCSHQDPPSVLVDYSGQAEVGSLVQAEAQLVENPLLARRGPFSVGLGWGLAHLVGGSPALIAADAC